MELLYLETVDSTNKYAKENINNIADGTVVYTFNQTSGRGRLDRKWNFTGSDNIYASIVLKPSHEMKEVYSNLTQLLCIVLAEVIEEYSICPPKIKWPNDIRINGKKISGILAEAAGINNTGGYVLNGLILGFGVNLNVSQEIINQIDQPATSLSLESGNFIDKNDFLKKVINKFCLYYNKFIEEGFPLIREDYKKRAEFLNEEVTVKVFEKTYEGRAVDVTENGALKLINKDNQEQILYIGDIL